MTLILAVESSCDETSAAVVADGRLILSQVIASQIDLHRAYGGVFPELASRQHILSVIPVVDECLGKAGLKLADITALAVTNGPGLAGSLLVGVNVVKGLALSTKLPFIGVNHLEAHVYANWLVEKPVAATSDLQQWLAQYPAPRFPLLCLIVSGGHTELVYMKDHGQYQLIGRTIDDAAGEAFDKVARLLGLGYPGGPAIEAAANEGDPTAFDLPRAWLKDSSDFSFSGLKTAVLRLVQKQSGADAPQSLRKSKHGAMPAGLMRRVDVADLAASFQAAVVDVLVEKTAAAAAAYPVQEVLLAGGVAANKKLRQQMTARLKLPVRYPSPRLCTDNAAMVAAVGHFRYLIGDLAGWDLDVLPNLALVAS
jgi:N6-L-threonylcarbamoyladenine synthase